MKRGNQKPAVRRQRRKSEPQSYEKWFRCALSVEFTIFKIGIVQTAFTIPAEKVGRSEPISMQQNFRELFCGIRIDVLGNKNIKLEAKSGQGVLIKRLSAFM